MTIHIRHATLALGALCCLGGEPVSAAEWVVTPAMIPKDTTQARPQSAPVLAESAPPTAAVSVAATAQAAEPPAAATAPAAGAAKDDDEDIAARALERTLVQRGALLLPVWTAEVEPAFSYGHSSADLYAIVPGGQVGERRRSDNLVAALTGRIGLPWESQAEVRIPYAYQKRETVVGGVAIVDSDETGLGDVEIALSRQLLNERGWIPDTLFTVRWKADNGENDFTGRAATGSGFNGLSGTLVVAKSQDPLVFFGKLGYGWNLEDDKIVGKVDPGDYWTTTVGSVVAVSPYTSLNLSLNTLFVERTKVNGVSVPVSDATVAVFEIGASSILTPKVLVNLTAGLGLTPDSPDFQVVLSIPVRI